MKKSFLMWIFLFTIIVSHSSCSNDDESKFDYPMETLYGKWMGTAIEVKGKWIDITHYPYIKYLFGINFTSDGEYIGVGYFGNGRGNYEAIGNTIYTYVDGEEYARYVVKRLTDNEAELTMYMNEESINIRVKKTN